MGSPQMVMYAEEAQLIQVICDRLAREANAKAVLCIDKNGQAFAEPLERSRAAGDVLTTPLLPGLALPLARIFKD